MINVKKIASLARLSVSDAEASKLEKNLLAVLEHFEKIVAIKTDGVEPLVTPTDIEQVWRADQVGNTITTEEALQNAPEREGNLFRVPPVV